MGGIVASASQRLPTALQQISKQKAQRAAHAQTADEQMLQAALTDAEARQQTTYLLRSAAEKAQEQYRKYNHTVQSQRAAGAARGVYENSATWQQVLQNSRFQALLDEQSLAENLKQTVADNSSAAAEKVRALQTSARQHQNAARKSTSRWKLGTALLNLWGGH